jgi:hypothetical protein
LTQANPGLPTNGRDRAVRWSRPARVLIGLVAVYFVVACLMDRDALNRRWVVRPAINPNVAEARAILDGRLDWLPRRWDTAWYEGRVYNVYPPMFTFIAIGGLCVNPDEVPAAVMACLLLAVPALAYALFYRRTRQVGTTVFLTMTYVAGTSVLPVLDRAAGTGSANFVNHLLSQVGLLVLLLDYYGRRRIWPAAIGLMIAFWSRQLTLFYAIPLFALALRQAGSGQRMVRGVAAGAALAIIVAVPMVLNTLKFGDPLESGYRYVYVGRNDYFAEQARHGLFAPRFVPRNLYYMNIGLPTRSASDDSAPIRPNDKGTGIWWTTPLLCLLFVDARRILRDRDDRVLLLAAGLVFGGLMLYHVTGASQPGYNRFSLDFVPVLLAIVATGCAGTRRTVATVAFAVWSVLYFQWAIEPVW